MTSIPRIVSIFSIFIMAMTTYVLADSECPDDSNTTPRDSAGCPIGDITVAMFLSPPYLLEKDGSDNGTQGYPSGIVFDYIVDTLFGCCHEKTELVTTNDDILKSDIIFPVSESDETNLTFSGVSYTFYDIVKVDGFVLIGLIDQYNAKARGLVLRSLYDSWPIFALTFLLTGIAGIFIWALEYYVKNEEFSLSFTRGSYDGFWWAFISMTTVGYGDKSPRSFFGRLFGVFWILIGLVVITMFTATVTSALTHSSSPDFINALEGLKVAVLNGSFAEAEATYLGAISSPYPEFEDMHAAMVKEEVEGLFMERLQAYYFYKDKNFYDGDNLRVFHTVPTKISHKMAFKQDTTCQLIEKNYCFKRRLENPLISSYVRSYTTPLKAFNPSVDTVGLLSGNSKGTSTLLLSLMGVFFGLCVLGVSVELFLWKSARRCTKPVPFQTKRERTPSDVNSFHLNTVLLQLRGFEENLEKLSNQIQTMKENLTGATRKTTQENVKLTEFN